MYYQKPYYRYYPTYYNNNNRLFPGGFLVPFGLGFLTAPLVMRPRPYYYPNNYNYYPNQYYY